MKVLLVVGLVIVGLVLISTSFRLLAMVLALPRIGDDANYIGQVLGTLLLEVVLIWVFTKLFQRVRRT